LLTSGSKIIAYFSFGVLLLGISYLYQKVSSRMEEIQARETEQPNEPDLPEDEKNQF
jgi:uncharacterized membrane protein